MNKKILFLLLALLLVFVACDTKNGEKEEGIKLNADLSKYEEASILSVGDNTILTVKNDDTNPILAEVYAKGAKIYIDEKEKDLDDLKPGMDVKLDYTGPMMKSYPGKMNSEYIMASSLKPNQVNDKVGFYLQVVKDMFEKDQALQADTRYLGLDIENPPVAFSEVEKNALNFRLQSEFGKEVIYTSFEELEKEGKIVDNAWKDGVLISIKSNQKEGKLNDIEFSVEKWRSGLGAIGSSNCKATWDENGELKSIDYMDEYVS